MKRAQLWTAKFAEKNCNGNWTGTFWSIAIQVIHFLRRRGRAVCTINVGSFFSVLEQAQPSPMKICRKTFKFDTQTGQLCLLFMISKTTITTPRGHIQQLHHAHYSCILFGPSAGCPLLYVRYSHQISPGFKTLRYRPPLHLYCTCCHAFSVKQSHMSVLAILTSLQQDVEAIVVVLAWECSRKSLLL